MTQTTQKHETSRPIPIPRTGITGAPNLLLHILLCLTSIMIAAGAANAFDALRVPRLAVEIFGGVLLLLIGVYFFRIGKLTGKMSRGFLPVLIFGSVLLIYLTSSTILAAVCFSAIFYMGEGAILLATQPKKSLVSFPLVPLVAFGVAALVCKELDVALLTLIPLPATIALAQGTRSSAAKENGLTRVGVICLTSLCFGITVVGFGLWFLHQSLGTLEISAIRDMLDTLRTQVTAQILELNLTSGQETIYPFQGQEALVADTVAITINILPGIFVAFCNIVATLAQMLTLSGLTAFGFGDSVTGRVKAFRISVVSSFVFLLAWIVALIANAESTTLVGTVAENFTIILMPGMALAGFLRLTITLAKKGCAPGCLLILVFFIPCVSTYAFIIFAMYEAIAAVFGPLVAKLKPPKNDDDHIFPPQGGQDDNNDSDDSNQNNNDNDNDNNDNTNDQGPRLF